MTGLKTCQRPRDSAFWSCVMPLLLLLAFTGCGVRGTAGDVAWKPVVCDSAKPYRGPALHRPPAREVFVEAAKPFGGAFDSATVSRLERAMEKAMLATKAPAMTVAVGVPGRGVWSATRGADGEAPRWFWFASVGKAFTAAVVLQLVEEGKLSLDDKLARWFPDYPNAKAVTIDHLLSHTSGIYSFQNDPALQARRGYRAPEELIEIARTHGNGFCPGEYWAYSNTGYVMLGRIVERIEGRAFHEVLTTRVIQRLGLHHTKALAPREKASGIAQPHPSEPSEGAAENAVSTTPYAAGNVVATAADMIEFWQALLGGKLLKPETVRGQFERLHPMFDKGTFYGRGVMFYDVPIDEIRRLNWLGHGGGAPGSKALVVYSADARAFVAVALNNDGSAEATVGLLLKALDKEP